MSLPGTSRYTDLLIAAPFYGWEVNETHPAALGQAVVRKDGIATTVAALSGLVSHHGWRQAEAILRDAPRLP